MEVTKRSVLVLAALATIVFFSAYIAFYLRKEKAVPFEMFFSTPTIPQSARWLGSGKQRPISGGGTYILLFTIPKNEISNLATNNGFVSVDINDDPNQWRLSLCNSLITELVGKGEITPEFEAYSKGSATNSNFARLFYDTNQQLAVVIGRGTYLKPGGNTRF